MKLWHKSHQENVWLMLLWMKTATGLLQPTTHPLDAAGLKEIVPNRRWYRGLMPSTGYCSALTLDQPTEPGSLLFHAHFLPHWPALCVSWGCSTYELNLSIQRWSYGECQVQRGKPFSTYMLICFKRLVRCIFQNSNAVYMYSWKNHVMKVLITFALTAQRTTNSAVCEMQVRSFWHYMK